jgi:anti-sigma factor RsiW
MTCAETRRLLPAPEPQHQAAVSEHLHGCTPCRAESEALREVDRRLVRLGEIRASHGATALRRLDQRLTEQLGLPGPSRRAVPTSRALIIGLGALTAAVLLLLALAVLLVVRHR